MDNVVDTTDLNLFINIYSLHITTFNTIILSLAKIKNSNHDFSGKEASFLYYRSVKENRHTQKA